MRPIAPLVLSDDVVALEPLSIDHAEELWRVASGPRESFALTRIPSTLDETREYIEQSLAEQARGVALPFAARDVRAGQPGPIVGTTRFMTIERWTWPRGYQAHERPSGCADCVEIGATWLSPDVRRTAVNTHAKLLMLTHAFEVWEVRRVTLKTDARNARSRAAIERLGARPDGVLRAHMPGFDGAVRDTAFYSVVAAEWPAVKERLLALSSGGAGRRPAGTTSRDRS
jgi:RimJ/RimL family protein N-acetyltransferase